MISVTAEMNGFAKVCVLISIIPENSFDYSEIVAIVNIILRLIVQYFTIFKFYKNTLFC